MAGIKDIAKKAGYSISTVSYALNGSTKVTEATREKIIKIAQELEYVPNGAARMLRARETKIIGIFLLDYSGSFYGQLLKGMRESLNQNGYELVVCSGKQSRRLLLEKMMDGAIILDESFSNEEIISYADLGHKIIVLDRELHHENINVVLLDNKRGAEIAVKALLEKAVKKLFIVTGPEGSYDSKQRLHGVETTLSLYPEIEAIQIRGNFTKEAGEKATERILQGYTEPVAVFCLNDEMAVGVYRYLKRTDYVIGRDIYIVGFDNIELSEYIEPRLTTISYSAFKWGFVATNNLLKLLHKQSIADEKIHVELINGKSC